MGPPGLLDALEQRFSAHGVPDRLHTERFRPGIVVTAGEGGAVTFTTVRHRPSTPMGLTHAA